MLNLYIKPSCPYCNRVLAANTETIGAPLVLIDITTDNESREELIRKGGKAQVPYLEDTDRHISMYESRDIIEYLSSHYGPTPIKEKASVPQYL